MKIGIITPNNIWFSPYVKIYTSLLDEIKVNYEIISWNREGCEEEGIQFNYKPKSRNPFILLYAYKKFASNTPHKLYKSKTFYIVELI